MQRELQSQTESKSLLLALRANERVCERENDDVIAVSADIVVAVDFQVKILTRLKR